MTTKLPRLNITLGSKGMDLLALLAQQEEKSLSSIARELIEEALELREDIYFSRLSSERDTSKAVWLSHKNAWE